MSFIHQHLSALPWDHIRSELHDQGFVTVPEMLSKEECEQFKAAYHEQEPYRKTVSMERYRFGLGEYKYFGYPLPEVIETLREYVYGQIAPVANQWMRELGIDRQFPATHPEMIRLCHEAGQTKPTALILSYGPGGFNTMHQDLYGEVFFPMQMVFMLDRADVYTGGEFVLLEQIPRAQSKANVLRPELGDMLIFTTNFRPVKGSRGYYRVNMKHGVSPVHSGQRHSLGIIFHDAQS